MFVSTHVRVNTIERYQVYGRHNHKPMKGTMLTMGKLKKIEISKEVIEFYRGQTAGMNRSEADYFVHQAQAGEFIAFADRVKRLEAI